MQAAYCGGCVCYCMGVVFVIVWGLCLYCMGIVFVIVWGLCLYCMGVVFVIVIFVWFEFNNVVWDKIGEVRGWSFIMCCLCLFEIVAIDKELLDLSVSHFVPHFDVSAFCLKCTEHVDHDCCVFQ